MFRGLIVFVLAAFFGQLLPATTVGVYFNQADWEAAMTLNGQNPLTPVSFDDSQWSSNYVLAPRSESMVSQSFVDSSLLVSATSTCGAPGICPSQSQLGQVSNGVWSDTLEKYSSTDFSFSSAIYGFGGDFTIANGNGLYLSVGGDVPYPYYTGTEPFFQYPGYSGFIGIVTDEPITDLFISWGDDGTCCGQYYNSYTLSNFEVATIPTPEPNFGYAFAGVVLLMGCYAFARR